MISDPLLDLFPVHDDAEDISRRIVACLGPWQEHGTGPFSHQSAMHAGERDEFCAEAVAAWNAAGLMDVFIPRSLGGSGDIPMIYRACALLARRDPSIASALGAVVLGTLPIRLGGTAAQQAYWFQRVRLGELAGLALTEWEHGSDLGANDTTAHRVRRVDGEFQVCTHSEPFTHYRLQGTKHTINNGTKAGFLVTLARTSDRESGKTNVLAHSLFVVDRHLPGISDGSRHRTHGFKSVDISDVHFRGCVVPKDALLSKEGQGFRIARRTLEISRGGISAFAVGQLSGALSLALTHAQNRRLYGGKRIADFPLVAEALTSAYVALEVTAALSAWAALATVVSPMRARLVTAAAKLFCTLEATRAIGELALVLGARGLLRDNPFERFRRDVWILPIFDGTAHLQQVELAAAMRSVLLDPDQSSPAREDDFARAQHLWRTGWQQAGGVDADLLAEQAELPRRDPSALDQYGCSAPTLGFQVVAASRRSLKRLVVSQLANNLDVPNVLTISPVEARLAIVFARSEAAFALGLRCASAPASPAWRLAALKRALGDLAADTLNMAERENKHPSRSLLEKADRLVLKQALIDDRNTCIPLKAVANWLLQRADPASLSPPYASVLSTK